GSGVAASDLGPGNYASYQSLYEMVMDLAARLQEFGGGSSNFSDMFSQYSTSSTATPMKEQIYRQISGVGAGQATAPAAGGGGPLNRISLTQPTSNPFKTQNINVAAMRKRAQELAGQAYVYGGGHGGADAGGFDCSGYVIEVMRAGGISVPF